MPTVRRSDAVPATITVPSAPMWSAVPAQSGTVGTAFTTLGLRQYLDDGNLETTVTAELKMAIHRVSDDDIDLEAVGSGGSFSYGAVVAAPTRIYVLENDSLSPGANSEVRSYGYDGTRYSSEDIDLPNGTSFRAAFRTATRLYFVDMSGTTTMCYAYDLSRNRQSTDDIDIGTIRPDGAFATSNRIYFVGDVPDTAYVFDLSGTRQSSEDISLGSGQWLSGFATSNRLYFVNNTGNAAIAYDHSGTRQSNDDISLSSAAWVGSTATFMTTAMESDRIYLLNITDDELVAYTLHDDLPAGLSISDNAETEVTQVSGTPEQEQTFTACFKAENSLGEDTVDVEFAIAA